MSLPGLWDQNKKGHELSPKYGWIYYHGEGLWNENISCHINQQEMSQPSVISGLQKWKKAPQTEIQQMLPSPTMIAEELGECKKQGEQRNRIGPR